MRADTPAVHYAAPRWVVPRLVALMLLTYWSIGLWQVTVYSYIAANTEPLGAGVFRPGFVGYSATAAAIGALVSPALVGWLSDRFLPAQKVLAVLHLLSGLALVGMLQSGAQASFYVSLLVFYQAFVPTITLCNTVALRHLADPDQQFAFVRTFGTVGYCLAGLFVGLAWPLVTGESIETTRTPIFLALLSQGVLALYCWTLPYTPPSRHAVGWRNLGRGAAVWRNGPLVLLLAVSFLATVAPQAYGAYMNVYLNQSGYENAAAKQTIAQMSEIVCMLAMPALLKRFGLKPLFLLGMLSWAARYAMLSAGSATGAAWPVYIAIAVHGPSYVFVYVTSLLYVDRLTSRDSRAAAQGYHALATSGLGHMAGAVFAGWLQATLLTPQGVTPPPNNWPLFWLAPALLGLVTAAVFAAAFREPPGRGGEHPELHARDLPPSPADAIIEPVSR